MCKFQTDKDKANFDSLINILKNSGTIYGHFAKDQHDSEFSKAWKDALEEANLGHVCFCFNIIEFKGIC